jgi:hypothetical protein
MTERKNPPSEDLADREFVITRVFDAPGELVWKAHSEVERREAMVGAERLHDGRQHIGFPPGRRLPLQHAIP